MNKSRIVGGLVCLATLLAGAAFIWGLAVESWRIWAVAIPVALGFLGVLALGFWIGWTIAATPTEVSRPRPEEESTPSETSDTSS